MCRLSSRPSTTPALVMSKVSRAGATEGSAIEWVWSGEGGDISRPSVEHAVTSKAITAARNEVCRRTTPEEYVIEQYPARRAISLCAMHRDRSRASRR